MHQAVLRQSVAVVLHLGRQSELAARQAFKGIEVGGSGERLLVPDRQVPGSRSVGATAAHGHSSGTALCERQVPALHLVAPELDGEHLVLAHGRGLSLGPQSGV